MRSSRLASKITSHLENLSKLAIQCSKMLSISKTYLLNPHLIELITEILRQLLDFQQHKSINDPNEKEICMSINNNYKNYKYNKSKYLNFFRNRPIISTIITILFFIYLFSGKFGALFKSNWSNFYNRKISNFLRDFGDNAND